MHSALQYAEKCGCDGWIFPNGRCMYLKYRNKNESAQAEHPLVDPRRESDDLSWYAMTFLLMSSLSPPICRLLTFLRIDNSDWRCTQTLYPTPYVSPQRNPAYHRLQAWQCISYSL